MRNKLVVLSEPEKTFSSESIYEHLAQVIQDRVNYDKAFKTLEKGFEAYDILSQLKRTIEKSKFTTGLESSIVNTFNYYKDLVEDYSPSTTLISLESHSDVKIKKTIALEGTGNFLKRIWEAIVNFFKRIWNWITGSGGGSGSSSSRTVKAKEEKIKENIKETVKKIEENKEVKEESNNKKVIIKDIDNEKEKQLFDAMREKLKYFIKKEGNSLSFNIKGYFSTLDEFLKESISLLDLRVKEFNFLSSNFSKYMEKSILSNYTEPFLYTRDLVKDADQKADAYTALGKFSEMHLYNGKTIKVFQKPSTCERYLLTLRSLASDENYLQSTDEKIRTSARDQFQKSIRSFGNKSLVTEKIELKKDDTINPIYYLKDIESIKHDFSNYLVKQEQIIKEFEKLKDIDINKEMKQVFISVSKEIEEKEIKLSVDYFLMEERFLFGFISSVGGEIMILNELIKTSIEFNNNVLLELTNLYKKYLDFRK